MNKIINENYFDLIIDTSIAPTSGIEDNLTLLNERHSILHVLNNSVDTCNLRMHPYHRFPSLFTLMSTIGLEKSGIAQVQRNPYLALYGRGVIVGIVDTGINYQHPAFRNNDGSSRILSIWDQTIQEGNTPFGFTFGSEYERPIINLALSGEEPLAIVPSEDTNGHGTAIASIITGKPSIEDSFSGIATEADLVVVKLKQAKRNIRQFFFVPEDAICYQETDVILGIRYLHSVAQQLKRPLVICIALGTNQGGHDGRGATSNYINYFAQLPGIDVAVAAGNEGNTRRHYYGSVNTAPFFTNFELRVGSREKSFAFEIWPDEPSHLSIEITSPTGEKSGIINPTFGNCVQIDLIFGATKVWVNNMNFEEETGNQLIFIRFQDPMEGVWYFQFINNVKSSFSFHSWLPTGDLISSETYFLKSDPDTTITSPGSSIHPLTLSAYDPVNNSFLVSSSRGYTRTNQIKPTVAAPGYQIPCAASQNSYSTMTGTGAAAAHATGIIAMMLEWAVVRGNYTSMTGNDINQLIIRGATRDEAGTTYPNKMWGYGRININGVFESLI